MSHLVDDEFLSQEEIFDLLSNSRRRYILRRLGQNSEPVELCRLADEIAAKENEKSLDLLNYQERKRVSVSLHQTHIPFMVETGLIEYNSESGKVIPNSKIVQLQSYLRHPATQHQHPLTPLDLWAGVDILWRLANTGLAVGGIVVLMAIAFILSEIETIPPIVHVIFIIFGVGSFILVTVFWLQEWYRYEYQKEGYSSSSRKFEVKSPNSSEIYNPIVEGDDHDGSGGLKRTSVKQIIKKLSLDRD